jgi:AcrR family transcriptional regulator
VPAIEVARRLGKEPGNGVFSAALQRNLFADFLSNGCFPVPTRDICMSVRENILKIATRRFAAVGYEATSMRSIASRARVTLPTIYHYFGDKESLYFEVCLTTFSPRAERALEFFKRSAASEEARIYGFFVGLANDLLNDENFFKLLHREMIDQDKEGIRRLTERCWKQSFETLIKSFQHVVAAHRDPSEITFACFALMLGLVEFRRKAPFLRENLGKYYTPEALAELVLRTTVPEINWAAQGAEAA